MRIPRASARHRRGSRACAESVRARSAATSPSAPESAHTAWKRCCAAGIPSSVSTAPPPADWPAIVTRAGSPPNAAMLSRTHSSAASQSRTPRFDGAPGMCPKPSKPSRYETDDGHDAVAVERAAVVPGARGRARRVAAAVDVDEHRQRGIRLAGRRGEDVDVEGRLAGDRRLGDQRDARVAALRRRAVLERVADALPRLRRHGRGEAQVADGRLGERDAEERGGCPGRAGLAAPEAADPAGCDR